MNNRRQALVRMITCALLLGLSILLSRVASVRLPIAGISGIRLSFGLMPVIVAGVLFGPAMGFVTGFLSDLLGFILFPSGMYMPAFSITYGLSGMLPALFVSRLSLTLSRTGGRRRLVYRYELDFDSLKTVWRLLVGITLSQALNSVLLNSLFISLLFGRAFMVLLVPRAIAQAVLAPIMALLTVPIIYAYRTATRTRELITQMFIPSGR